VHRQPNKRGPTEKKGYGKKENREEKMPSTREKRPCGPSNNNSEKKKKKKKVSQGREENMKKHQKHNVLIQNSPGQGTKNQIL